MNVVFSSYEFAPPTGATIVPIGLYEPLQSLFGTASQIQGLAGAYQQAAHIGYCYFPELVSPHAFARHVQSELLGFITPGTIHVRVGSRRRARVIKGCRNVLITSDNPTTGDQGSDSYLVKTLVSRADVLFETCFYLSNTSSTLLHDLAQPTMGVVPNEQSLTKLDEIRDSLEVASFTKFAISADSYHLRTPSLWQSSHEHYDALHRTRADGGVNLLIPFNLDHDQTIIPALLTLLARASRQASQPINIVVFPFNESQGSKQRLVRLAADCLNLRGADQRLASLFFALAPSRSSLRDVQTLFSCAVLDLSDPDVAWSRRRLEAIGVPLITMGVSDRQTTCPDVALGSPQEHVLLDDELGSRIVTRAVPTMADTRAVLSLIQTRHRNDKALVETRVPAASAESPSNA